MEVSAVPVALIVVSSRPSTLLFKDRTSWGLSQTTFQTSPWGAGHGEKSLSPRSQRRWIPLGNPIPRSR